MSEEKKRRKVTRGLENKRCSIVAARRRAEGKSRRDVSVEEGVATATRVYRAASLSAPGSRQGPGRWDESTNLVDDRR